MGDGKRSPHVVRRQRPANPTTPISTAKLAELVEDLRTPEPAQTLELPVAVPGDEDVVELTVDDDPPPPPPKTRNAHVVRRPKKP